MATSLFSTYRTGENRVTASILAVLRSLVLSRTERLLGALLEQADFELVRFQNQPAHRAPGVPDAAIVSSCHLLIETKIERNAVQVAQLQRHLQRLDHTPAHVCSLLVLTPDEARPAVLDQLADGRLVWASFTALDQAIEELLADPTEVISEREAFLLRELQAMLADERLLESPHDTVVVAARQAWAEYQQYHAYICQPARPFQPVRSLAFYTAGQICPLIPRILAVHEVVVCERGRSPGRVGQLVEQLLAQGVREEGASYKVFLLSAPDAPDTVRLQAPIRNDLRGASGRTIAFTQGQRYVRLDALVHAHTTSEVVAA